MSEKQDSRDHQLWGKTKIVLGYVPAHSSHQATLALRLKVLREPLEAGIAYARQAAMSGIRRTR